MEKQIDYLALVKVNKDQVITTSRKVAEVFDKRHDNILRDIENILAGKEKKTRGRPKKVNTGGVLKIEDTPQGVASILDVPLRKQLESMFIKTTYVNEQNGETYTEYAMNRDGLALLVMGFTGEKALRWKLAYIEAFNMMEAQIRNDYRNRTPDPTTQLGQMMAYLDRLRYALLEAGFTAREVAEMELEAHRKFGIPIPDRPGILERKRSWEEADKKRKFPIKRKVILKS